MSRNAGPPAPGRPGGGSLGPARREEDPRDGRPHRGFDRLCRRPPRPDSKAPSCCSRVPAAGCPSPSGWPAGCRRPTDVLELDVTNPEHPAASSRPTSVERFGRLDGILHSIGYAPDACLGRGMFEADWEDVATAVEISAYSLKVLASAFVGAARGGRRCVDRRARLRRDRRLAGLRLDGRRQGGTRVAHPLPRPGPRVEGDPRQPGRRRTDPHGRGEVDPRLRAIREGLGRTGRPSAGTSTGTARRSRGPASRCCRTGSPGRRERSFTSTAVTTRSGREAVGRTRTWHLRLGRR